MQIALLRSTLPGLTARTAVALAVLATAAEGESSRSWIQVARVGTFKNYWDGKKLRTFTITQAMLAEMHDNFVEGRHPVPPTELCIDYEHLSSPDVALADPVQGKAAGWVKNLELRENGDEIWAEIEWTDPAATAIRAKEFKYFSPEFAFDYTTHDASDIGCTLLAGAITNRPFIQGMEAVTLRAGGVADVLAAELSFDQRRVFVERALVEQYRAMSAAGQCASCYVWVCDIYDDVVVFSVDGGRKFRCDYTCDGAGVVVLGEFEEVVISYEPLTSGDEGDVTMKATVSTIKLNDRQGKEVEISTEALEATDLVKDLRAQLSQRVPKSDHDALQTKVVALTGRVDAQAKEIDDQKQAIAARDAKDAVDTIIAAGRATAGQRESLTELYLSNRDLFTKVTAGMTAQVVPQGELGHGNGPKTEGGDTPVQEVEKAIAEAMKADATLTYAQASERVFAKQPELYSRYVKATERRTGKAE